MPRRPGRNTALYQRLRDEQTDREQALHRLAEIERELGRPVVLIPPESRVDDLWAARADARIVVAETACEALELLRLVKVEAANDR
jgi:hypothetical protein